MSLFQVVQRILSKDASQFIEVRREDGHGSSSTTPSYGVVETDDSNEREYTPGLTPTLVTLAGDTTVYTPPAGKAWILHWSYAIPVIRSSQEPPVITVKTVDVNGIALATHYIAAAVSKRKQVTMPIDARLVVNLDISSLVPCTFDIELLP